MILVKIAVVNRGNGLDVNSIVNHLGILYDIDLGIAFLELGGLYVEVDLGSALADHLEGEAEVCDLLALVGHKVTFGSVGGVASHYAGSEGGIEHIAAVGKVHRVYSGLFADLAGVGCGVILQHGGIIIELPLGVRHDLVAVHEIRNSDKIVSGVELRLSERGSPGREYVRLCGNGEHLVGGLTSAAVYVVGLIGVLAVELRRVHLDVGNVGDIDNAVLVDVGDDLLEIRGDLAELIVIKRDVHLDEGRVVDVDNAVVVNVAEMIGRNDGGNRLGGLCGGGSHGGLHGGGNRSRGGLDRGGSHSGGSRGGGSHSGGSHGGGDGSRGGLSVALGHVGRLDLGDGGNLGGIGPGVRAGNRVFLGLAAELELQGRAVCGILVELCAAALLGAVDDDAGVRGLGEVKVAGALRGIGRKILNDRGRGNLGIPELLGLVVLHGDTGPCSGDICLLLRGGCGIVVNVRAERSRPGGLSGSVEPDVNARGGGLHLLVGVVYGVGGFAVGRGKGEVDVLAVSIVGTDLDGGGAGKGHGAGIVEAVGTGGSILELELHADGICAERAALDRAGNGRSRGALVNDRDTRSADVAADGAAGYGELIAGHGIGIGAVGKSGAGYGSVDRAAVLGAVNEDDALGAARNISDVAGGAELLALAYHGVLELVDFGNGNALVGGVGARLTHEGVAGTCKVQGGGVGARRDDSPCLGDGSVVNACGVADSA